MRCTSPEVLRRREAPSAFGKEPRMETQGALYPYTIDPKETPAIWGGDALVKIYGKKADPTAAIGESWECWDANAVTDGPFAGKTIADLRASQGATFLGNLDASRSFPILTKIIDARDASR